MNVSLVADTVASAAQSGLGLSNLVVQRQNLSISTAAIFDALAPPPVKSGTGRRPQLRKKRRTKRITDGSGNSGEEFGYVGGDGEGPFGGGGGGRGSGWNFGGSGEPNGDESSFWSIFSSGSAYGFIHDVIYWIAFSNCVHFAFMKVARILMGWVAVDDDAREKVPN